MKILKFWFLYLYKNLFIFSQLSLFSLWFSYYSNIRDSKSNYLLFTHPVFLVLSKIDYYSYLRLPKLNYFNHYTNSITLRGKYAFRYHNFNTDEKRLKRLTGNLLYNRLQYFYNRLFFFYKKKWFGNFNLIKFNPFKMERLYFAKLVFSDYLSVNLFTNFGK
jgi:hypothetical protein